MKQVVYRERVFKCIDFDRVRAFDTKWEVGGLTYFKHNQFTIFTIATADIIEII